MKFLWFMCITIISIYSYSMDQDFSQSMPAKDQLFNAYPTMNAHGYCFEPTDPLSIQFIHAVNNHRSNNTATKILEIGGGYGLLAEACLNNNYPGNTCVYVSLDLDKTHGILATKRIGNSIHNTDTSFVAEVGFFPDVFYEENSFTHIVASRVFHFYTPELFIKSLCTIEKILTKGGRAYIFTSHAKTESYGSAVYERYKMRAARNEEFPGFVADTHAFVSELVQKNLLPKEYVENQTFKKTLAEHFLFLTTKELCEKVKQYTNLNIIYSQTIHEHCNNKRKSSIAIILEKI